VRRRPDEQGAANLAIHAQFFQSFLEIGTSLFMI